jgi:hypothetical protein
MKGWLVKGKQYVQEMMGKINQDEQSDICKKWETMYQKLCMAASQVEKGGDDEDEEMFEMDEALLYAEL